MSGTATLTRPTAPVAPRVATLAPPTTAGPIRVALLLFAWAAAFAAVGCARDLVTSFGGTVRTLGSINPYADDAATALGWLLAAGALVAATAAARALGADQLVRRSLVVAVGGALLLAASAGASLWAVAVSGPTPSKGWLADAVKPFATGHEVQELSRAALALAATGWLVLAAAAGTAAAASAATRVSRLRRHSLVTASAGFALLAVGEVAKLVLYWSAAVAPGRAGRFLVWAPASLGWLVLAAASVLAVSALRASPATERLWIAAPFAALGALCLAAWSTTVLVNAQVELSGTGQSWFVTLSKVGLATEYAGLVALALAAGVAAARVASRDLSPR